MKSCARDRGVLWQISRTPLVGREKKYLSQIGTGLWRSPICERVTGIEPALQPWEGCVMPFHYTRQALRPEC